MTLHEIIKKTNKIYKPEYGSSLLSCVNEKGEVLDLNECVEKGVGDPLAIFIVNELKDTYNPKETEEKQLVRASGCLRSVAEQLKAIADSLHETGL